MFWNASHFHFIFVSHNCTTNRAINISTYPFILIGAKWSLTILMKSCKKKYNKEKIFDGEILIRTLATTLLQIFCKIILNLWDIVKSILDPDDNFMLIVLQNSLSSLVITLSLKHLMEYNWRYVIITTWLTIPLLHIFVILQSYFFNPFMPVAHYVWIFWELPL